MDFSFKSRLQPIIHPTAFVLGQPKSGKTVLAESLATDLELVYLTIPIIISSILEGEEVSKLYDQMNHLLKSGQELTDDVLTEAVSTEVYVS